MISGMKKDRTITSYRLQYAVIDNSTKSEKEEAELYDFVQKFTDNHGLFSDWPIDEVRAEMSNFFRGKDRLVAALLEIRRAGRRSVVGSISVYPISVPGLRLPSKLAYR